LGDYCKLRIELGVIVNLKAMGFGMVYCLLRGLKMLGFAGDQGYALPPLICLLYPMPTMSKVVAFWVLAVSHSLQWPNIPVG
jgi:hypothetical protein